MQRPLSGPPPKLKAPPGTCDTHMHVYDLAFPQHPNGPPLPAPATVDDYKQLKRWLGIERTVVVQPNGYGDDNRCTLDAVAKLGSDCARAVVVVKPSVSDTELERLHAAGARAIRVMCLPGGFTQWGTMDETIARVRPLGWHPIVQFDGREMVDREPLLKRIPGDYIIDHTGKFLEPVATDAPAMKALLRLIERGNCYVKIAAPYETSKVGKPHYDDVNRIARTLAHAFPERMLYASNWPHNGFAGTTYPDDAYLLDRLLDILSDGHSLKATLVDNAARLYGWQA